MKDTIVLHLGSVVHLPLSRRFAGILLTLSLLLLVSILLSLRLGSTPTTNSQILRWALYDLFRNDADINAIMLLRWPRIVAAILGGAMISASGYLLQVVSRNGLADPGLLGISQGTMAGVIIGAMVLQVPSQWLALSGLVGGLVTGTIVLTIASLLSSSNGLILIGLAAGTVLGAVVEVIQLQGGMAQFSRWMTWSHGSLAAVSVADARMIFSWAVILLPLAILACRSLTPMLLGAEQAAALGATPRLLLPAVTLLATALVAPVVAAVGPISFLGLIGAHVARRLVGERPGEVLPVSMITGACILLWADTLGRTVFLPVVVPAGIVVSITGVVAFLITSRLSRN